MVLGQALWRRGAGEESGKPVRYGRPFLHHRFPAKTVERVQTDCQ